MNNEKEKIVTISGPGKTLIQGKFVKDHLDGMVTIEVDDNLYTGYPVNRIGSS